MANKGRNSNNRNGHSRDAGYGTYASPRRPAQNSRRRTSGGQRNSHNRRKVNRPIYTKLGFWIAVCALIIVIVLIVKGCDTGNIDADKIPSAESLAPSVEPSSPEQGSDAGAQPGGTTGTDSPSSANQPSTPAQEPSQSPAQPTPDESQNAPEPSQSPVQPTPDVKPTTPNTNYYEEHEINAGVYLIGADIPSGTADLTAMSGTGSISTSNGSLQNPTFGTANSYTKYSENIVLSSGTSITVTGSLILRISYLTKPEIGASQTSSGDTVYTLTPGTHIAGDDFESGTYDFAIVSGYGTVTSSNAETGGGIDEMMGPADNGGNYAQKVNSISLPAGTVVTVTGCTVTITKRN